MNSNEVLYLQWHDHQSTLVGAFDKFLENGTFADCTLATEGGFINAHKIVLSACSPYFAALLSQQYDKHPIFILKDVEFQELRAMMDYMYKGEVNIFEHQLVNMLNAAESLQIKGLSRSRSDSRQDDDNIYKQRPPDGLELDSAIDQKPDVPTHQDSTRPTSLKRKILQRQCIEANDTVNPDQLSHSSTHLIDRERACHRISNKNVEESQTNCEEYDVELQWQQRTRNKEVFHVNEPILFTHSGWLIEPKPEHDNVQETAEDLSFCGEASLKHLDQAGTSVGGEGSSQDGQINVFTAAQETVGQHHDDVQETAEDLSFRGEASLQHLDQGGISGGGEGSSQVGQDKVFTAAQETVGQHHDAQDLPKSLSAFFCDCGRSYKYHRGLIQHLKYECGKDASFQCKHCTFVCKHNYQLKRHLQKRHSKTM